MWEKQRQMKQIYLLYFKYKTFQEVSILFFIVTKIQFKKWQLCWTNVARPRRVNTNNGCCRLSCARKSGFGIPRRRDLRRDSRSIGLGIDSTRTVSRENSPSSIRHVCVAWWLKVSVRCVGQPNDHQPRSRPSSHVIDIDIQSRSRVEIRREDSAVIREHRKERERGREIEHSRARR